MPVTTTVSVSDTANPQDVIGCVAFSPALNQLSPDLTASQRTRHNQQRHARAAAGYVGQETIDTVGTITTGIWQGDPIAQEHLQILSSVTCLWSISGASFAANYTYANGQNGVGATITANAAGTITADFHQLAAGDTVLVTGTITGGASAVVLWSGVYLVTTAPSSVNPGVLTRHPAFNRLPQFFGALIIVQNGSTYGLTSWLCNVVPVAIGQTGFQFAATPATITTASGLIQINGSASITATGSPTGLMGTLYALSVNATWVGQTSITTVGTIGTGTWAGTTIAINHGGTGQTTAGAAFDALSPMTTLGDVIYGGTSGTNTRLAGNTTATRNFLRQTGTGTVSAAPAWDTVTKTDVGLSVVENTALSTWAGSTNLTTLGTVTAGTWQAAVASTTVITFDTAVQTVRAEGTIDKTVASASFTSVAAAATIYSLTIKGGLLGTSGAVRVKIAGTYIANSGTPTFTFAITYGATTLWQDATGTFGASAINGAFEIHFTLNAANATNSQAVTGRITLGVKTADPTTGHGRINSSPLYDGTLTGTSAEDSTADKTLAVTFLPNVNNGSVGLTRLFACTEAMP